MVTPVSLKSAYVAHEIMGLWLPDNNPLKLKGLLGK
jgi:hypothetical protein